MARKARGGRGVMSPSAMDRLLLRRIENCKFQVPVLCPSHTDSIVDHLRPRFPEYGRLKLQPFTRRVHDVLLHLHPPPHANGATGDSREEDDGSNGSSSRKRRGGGGGRDGDEERLLLAEEEHLRRKRKKRESTSSSVSSASNSSSTYSSEEEDAVFDAKLDPDFDITKVMLREKYKKQAVAAVTCRSEGKEDVVMEIENAVDKPKRRLLGSAGGREIEQTPAVARGGGEGDSGELEKGMETVPPRFQDFGGIKGVLEELTMEVIVPLLHPELPRELGVRPMAGILLHGPPGCGKTRLAHAIANETGVPFFRISATEVVSGVSGESEENIRNLFKKAYRTTPSIVFIDEIDAIASKRENLQKEMERRIVTQLMTCMDECHQTLKSASDSETSENKPGYVLVIGATNRPDAVDPALRRPGRFDHEIVLGVPDENARKEILTVFTKKLKLEGTFDLQKVAKSTPGFVGADLKALVDKAGRLAIRRINYRRKIEFYRENKENDEYAWVKQTWAPKEMVGLNITMVDFEEAAKLVQPSLRREGFSSIPAVKWDDVGGLDSIRREFNRYIVRHIKNHEKYEKLGVTSETGFLLYGPPGCGKTLIAKAVANEAGANFIYIKGPELLNKYVGESELAIRTIFSRARTCSPCILFFDEIDALATKRGNDGGWVVERLLNQLLLELDGADERRGVYVIGATNRLEVVDPALLRPRRLGKVLYVTLPNEEERVLILKALVRKSPLASDVDLDRIGRSEACMNFSGADLGEVVKEAMLIASDEEDPVAIELDNLAIEHSLIKASHFEQALKKVSPSVSEKEREYYEVLSRSFKVR